MSNVVVESCNSTHTHTQPNESSHNTTISDCCLKIRIDKKQLEFTKTCKNTAYMIISQTT
ncbi:hypothetical protein ACF0H5_021370 [Mactra antiquata]